MLSFVLMLQLDSSDTYAGSTFSLRELASVNHSSQRVNGRSVSVSSPWQTQSRPAFSSAVQSPSYNGFHGTVAVPRFSSRRTPFSYNDSPSEMVNAQCRPAATTVVTGKVHMFLCLGYISCLYRSKFY